ncbi:MAG TPA: hypothetical protein VF789_18355 [Thermoanaerobaculia bacterium]
METTRRLHLRGGLALLALVFPALAAAQPTPLIPPFLISGGENSQQYLPSVAAEPGGAFVVAWMRDQGFDRTILAQRFTAAGEPATGVLTVSLTPAPGFFVGPDVAVHAATGNFLVVWETGARVVGRVFDRAGTPLTGEVEVLLSPSSSAEIYPMVAATPAGFVVTGRLRLEDGIQLGIFARRLDPAGAVLGSAIEVDEGQTGSISGAAVAADAEGTWGVVWGEGDEGLQGVRGRLFDPDGTPRTGEIPLADGFFLVRPPAVAFGPDGGFLATWGMFDLYVRAFDENGAPRGPVTRVNPRLGGEEPEVAPDGHGGFAVFWSAFVTDASRGALGRLVDGSGRPRGPAFLFSGSGSVAAGPPGQIAVVWNAFIRPGGPTGVYGQRFAIPPATGADPCVLREGRLVCDTLRGESGATLEVPLEDLQAGDRTLLGDFDGDRRDDACVYRRGSFRCDLDHNGVPEAGVAFGGQTGDVPLLGDVNGDGREDACLRRGRRFSCDTARNGGTGEVQILLGLKTDLALMGDIDGDGDGDPCLFRGDRFLCDTVHDGNRAEVTVVFGLPGDVPLLGDADGDGDDDPCVFRGDRFLCDTTHDGGAAEIEILFGEPGAIPLLGNVDGF